MGTSQTDFAHFGKHLLIFLVKHIFVEEEGDDAVAEAVPHGGGYGARDETTNHERACLEAAESLRETDSGDGLEEMHLATGVEEQEDARLVEMGAHLAFEHLAYILVGVVGIPVVDNALGGVGTVLEFAPDETGEFVKVVNDRGLLAGDDFLIVLVSTLHLAEEFHLIGREVDRLTAKIFGEAGGLEVGGAFVDGLLAAGDGDGVELVKHKAIAVDDDCFAVDLFKADAIVVKVKECGDAIAAASSNNMDGGGGHAEDGVNLVEGDGVLRHKALLA